RTARRGGGGEGRAAAASRDAAPASLPRCTPQRSPRRAAGRPRRRTATPRHGRGSAVVSALPRRGGRQSHDTAVFVDAPQFTRDLAESLALGGAHAVSVP